MNIEQVLFYVFAAFLLGSALLVVTVKSLVRSIFLFFVTLLSVAGVYVFALADFVAVTQIIMYVGGVLVLMLFAFLLSNKELLNDLKLLRSRLDHAASVLPALIIAAFTLAVLAVVIHNADVDHLAWVTESKSTLVPSDNTIHLIGTSVMTTYLFPFEVVSVFLMMALIGAAHLARKERKS